MKKIFLLAAMLMTLLTCTAFAAQNSYNTTKVVLISGAEFKTKDYYKIVEKNLGTKTKTAYECGDEIQRSYQMFMMDRYDIGEDKPRKQDMIDFAERNSYKNVVFIILDENIDTHSHGKHSEKIRSTIQMDAYLVSNDRIADFATTSQEFTSKASNLRARRGAFEKCLKEVANVMNLY
ncbi:MAG: hypothetical protein IJT73_09405 [Selenomonadaceae bacterium]|nr:hypothetical protein [Selenomonadaceae bacterium]